MLKVSINYHFHDNDYPLLKEAAALYLSEISPTLRLELLSRWCGFSTLVSFRTALSSQTEKDIYLVLDTVAARTFAETRGILLDASACHHTLTSAAFAKVAREHPHLHGDGYGRHSAYVLDHERREIQKTLPAAEVGRAIFALRENRFEKGRTELLTVRKSDEFIRALALCSALTPIKTVNRKHSSYNLKHRAEERSYTLEGGAVLPHQYVSNSSLIAAAFYAGFETDADRRENNFSSPNINFNISQRSLNAAIEKAPKEDA